MSIASNDLHTIFDARRLKAPDLQGLDFFVNGLTGTVRNRVPILGKLKEIVARVSAMEPQVRALSSTRFREDADELKILARTDRLEGEPYIKAWAFAREACWRALEKRPFDVQLIGAIALTRGAFAEMATGEGKTITAALAASIWGWSGKPVHVITVNDYLVARDAENMRPIYSMMGLTVGAIVHDLPADKRPEVYRRNVVYSTSKELVADYLRDQIILGQLKTSSQTRVSTLMNLDWKRRPLMIPGLFRCIVDEADSLLIDEAVTPLIISNEPDGNANADLYIAAHKLAEQLTETKDFKVDRTVKSVDLTEEGQDHIDALVPESHRNFWRGRRRREELVTQALTALYCFHRDEQYLVDHEGKVQIIDEFTGRVMADRSWRHGLHQAIEVKEGLKVSAEKENLAHMSFQRFFRQYPLLGGMTGTAWESSYELWQIYRRRVIKVPTNKPCIRVQTPTQMFDTQEQKWAAVIDRVKEIHAKGAPILIGTRSVAASEEVARRLTAAGIEHKVLNAAQNAEEAAIIAEAGQPGHITVATNMAGRGTDIYLGRGVDALGGLHVISTEPNTSYRIDRQLYGRAARQGNPGTAQLFAASDDELFLRHAPTLRKFWKTVGADRLIAIAQNKSDKLATFNRRQVLKNDDWMAQALPF
jgi:preprotein translocase subunit SecA